MRLRFSVDAEQRYSNDISPEAAGLIDGVFADACPGRNTQYYMMKQGNY